MKILSQSPEDTENFARDFLSKLKPNPHSATVVALSGELGVGKTKFVQLVAKALGVEASVPSPTFIIERVYAITHDSFDRLIHIDAYRLNDALELGALGWDEIIRNPRNLIFIEWPERLHDALPSHAYRIRFEHVNEQSRKIFLVS